jgi:RluA family pseudouridine synthase
MLAGMWQWQVSEYESGHLLLDALLLRVPAAPRAFLHQTIRKERILLGGQVLAADQPVSSGMCLTVKTSARFEALAGPCGVPPWDLLYEDHHTLVIYKPAGLAMHQTAGHDDNLLNRAARFVAWRRAPYRLAPVHRLDIGTSGPVLLGKGRWATGRYGRLLTDRRIGKHYLALVAGSMPIQGQLTTPVSEGEHLRPAMTRFQLLAATEQYSLVELELVTGRRHQARQQLADAGWPIVGDQRYGGPSWPGLDRLFLHCHHLLFPDLATQRLRQVDCPLPGELRDLLAVIGLPAVPIPANHQ